MKEGKNMLAVRIALETSGAAAERQLVAIGHEAGDEELQIVVQRLKPGEVAAIVCEGDYTRPSIAATLITKSQFLGALEHLGARWGVVKGYIQEGDIEIMIRDALDYLLSVILTGSGDHRREMVKSLCLYPLGLDVVTSVVVRDPRAVEFIGEEIDIARIEVGTIQELLVEIFEHRLDDFKKIRSHALAVKGSDNGSQLVQRTLRALARKAKHHAKVGKKQTKTYEVFVNI